MEHINKKYVFFTVTFLCAVILIATIFTYNHFKTEDKSVYISELLKSKDYAYLPQEAKDFIADAYLETGEVILTEKNKDGDKPYLNPKYIEYLSMSDEEKKEMVIIPNPYLIDAEYASAFMSATYPSSYDLRNADGNSGTTDSYITPLKNQGSLNLCWAFASVEVAESHLMVKNKTPNSTQAFSIRQMDYALSSDGISNATNSHELRTLASGGNFLYSNYIMANGLSLFNDSIWPYGSGLSTKKYHEVFNYSKSMYEVNGSVSIPLLDLTNSANASKKTAYLNTIKGYIMSNGGAFVSTQSPNASCASNNNGTYLIRVDNSCNENSAHGMQIIGWDDNYSYKYCNSGGTHSAYTSSCPAANTVSGTGAWLLRNSWGTSYSYVYLAYDSKVDEIGFITSMSSMSNKNWNNNYHTSLLYNGGFYTTMGSTTVFDKTPTISEKVQKVKIYAYGENATFNVSLCNGDTSSCYDAGSVTAAYPGYVTLDVSSKNIILNKDKFYVSVRGDDYFLINSVSVFTSNQVSTPMIKTFDIESDGKSQYYFGVYSVLKNIPDGSTITYKLYDSSGSDISSRMQVANNISTLNEVRGALALDNSLPNGKYTLKASYGGYTYSSNIILNGTSWQGTGTASDPYIIDSFTKMKLIKDNIYAYYRLDADLDYSTYSGTYVGVENFSGVFDGNGHTISNLNTPLFTSITGDASKAVTVKNLTLKNSTFHNKTNTGILANEVYDYGYNVNINGIAIIGGMIKSDASAGALFGRVNLSKTKKVTINNIYSSAIVGGAQGSGLIGILYHNSNDSSCYIDISNIQNAGYNLSSTNSSFVIGYTQNVIPNISNVIVSGKNINSTSFHSIIGAANAPAYIKLATIKNGYYSHGSWSVPDISGSYSGYTSPLTKKTPVNLTAISNVSGWTDYSTYWTTKTVDNVARMVTLKIAASKIDYTKFNTLSVKVGSSINIYNYLVPTLDAAKNISFSSKNASIATISSDGTIKGISGGTALIHVESYYDGYTADIPVNVLGDNLVTITFNANTGSGSMPAVSYTKNKSAILPSNTFTKKGYTFAGWNTKADGSGTNYANEATISSLTSNLTLYAKWTANTYTIKYNINGGSGSIGNVSATYDKNVTLALGPTPATGYKFAYWNTKADGSGTSYDGGDTYKNLTATAGETVTLYAIYTPISYYIVYNYQYNGSTTKKLVKYDANHTVISSSIAREYEFLGWNTKANGSGTTYLPGQKIKNLSSTDEATITLYAMWSSTPMWTVKDYIYSVSNGELSNVTNGTNVTNYLKKFTIASNYSFKVYNGTKLLGSSDLIGTGMITKIYKGADVVATFVNVIRGDVSGDGKVTSADYILIRKHIMETELINASAFKGAADVNKDSKITSADYILIRKYIMNGGTL